VFAGERVIVVGMMATIEPELNQMTKIYAYTDVTGQFFAPETKRREILRAYCCSPTGKYGTIVVHVELAVSAAPGSAVDRARLVFIQDNHASTELGTITIPVWSDPATKSAVSSRGIKILQFEGFVEHTAKRFLDCIQLVLILFDIAMPEVISSQSGLFVQLPEGTSIPTYVTLALQALSTTDKLVEWASKVNWRAEYIHCRGAFDDKNHPPKLTLVKRPATVMRPLTMTGAPSSVSRQPAVFVRCGHACI
jgi:hypothetical protein